MISMGVDTQYYNLTITPNPTLSKTRGVNTMPDHLTGRFSVRSDNSGEKSKFIPKLFLKKIMGCATKRYQVWLNDKHQPLKGYVLEIVHRILLNLRQIFFCDLTHCENLICLKKNKKKVNTNEMRKESVNRVRSRTLVASRLCLSLAQTHSTFHSFIHSYVRSYFDVIKWKPYKNWAAPVTSSHIAGRRVIIHSILFLFSCFFFSTSPFYWKGESQQKK